MKIQLSRVSITQMLSFHKQAHTSFKQYHHTSLFLYNLNFLSKALMCNRIILLPGLLMNFQVHTHFSWLSMQAWYFQSQQLQLLMKIWILLFRPDEIHIMHSNIYYKLIQKLNYCFFRFYIVFVIDLMNILNFIDLNFIHFRIRYTFVVSIDLLIFSFLLFYSFIIIFY